MSKSPVNTAPTESTLCVMSQQARICRMVERSLARHWSDWNILEDGAAHRTLQIRLHGGPVFGVAHVKVHGVCVWIPVRWRLRLSIALRRARVRQAFAFLFLQ